MAGDRGWWLWAVVPLLQACTSSDFDVAGGGADEDTGAADGTGGEVLPDSGTGDGPRPDVPLDVVKDIPAPDVTDAPVVETGFDCGGKADGTVCGSSPRAICLKGLCKESICTDGFTDVARGEICDDGNTTNGDGCDNDCHFSCTSNAECADGKFCNGDETCNPSHVCVTGVAPDCNDGKSCSIDKCDDSTGAGSCLHIGIDGDGDGHVMHPCGDDCADDDPKIFPGEVDFYDVVSSRGTYDYDCDTVETHEWIGASTCSGPLGSCVFTLAGGWAFGIDDVACGDSQNTSTDCKSDGAGGCTPNSSGGLRKQACR
jgi:cysteine-rich repeat protein